MLLLSDIVASGQFNYINEGRTPTFQLSIDSGGESSSGFVWNPEDVRDFAVAVQFHEKGGGENNAEIFRHSLKVINLLRSTMIIFLNFRLLIKLLKVCREQLVLDTNSL